MTPPKRIAPPLKVKVAVAMRQAQEAGAAPSFFAFLPLPPQARLVELMKVLGLKRPRLDHNPALALRAYNEHDYDPPQHDPRFLQWLEDTGDETSHAHKTNVDNGSGRGDQTAIAHVRKAGAAHRDHAARMRAKATGEPAPDKPRSQIRSRGFSPGKRKLQSATFAQRRGRP